MADRSSVQTDKVSALRDDVDKVRDVVNHNIELAMENLEDANDLGEKTELLKNNAAIFQKQATQVGAGGSQPLGCPPLLPGGLGQSSPPPACLSARLLAGRLA